MMNKMEEKQNELDLITSRNHLTDWVEYLMEFRTEICKHKEFHKLENIIMKEDFVKLMN